MRIVPTITQSSSPEFIFAAMKPTATAAVLIVMLFLWATPAAQGQTGQWTQLNVLGPTPPPRAFHAMAYDSNRRVTVLFGGGNFDCKSDTWEYDGQSWALKATTGPSPRSNVSMVYDSARNVSVLVAGFCSGAVGETWEWNGSLWTQRTFTGGSPSARNDYAMAYDASRGVVVLHGGGGGAAASETWEYDGVAWTLKAGANGPSRASHAMVFDSDRNLCVMFGGNGPGDVWTYDGTTWVQHPTATGPSPRFYMPMVYDPIRKVCVIHGGNTNGPSQIGTFEWNGTSWRELSVGGRGAWQGDRMVFDTARNQIVSFGGTLAGAATDQSTWILQTLRPIIVGSYDASLGTLPSAQGWTLEEIGAASPPYSVGGGELRQGPTSPSGNQGWGIDNAQANFASQAGQVFELDARVVASTFDPNGSGPGNWRAGFTLLIVDRNLRLVALGLTNSGLVVSTDRNFALSTSVNVPLDTTSAFRRYRVEVNSTGTRVFVDDVLAASLGVPQPTFLITPKAYFGDLSTGSCDVRIRSVRWGTLSATVPLAAAGPNDNAYFTGTRPDPGAGSTTIYSVNSLTVDTGGSFTLGSGETLNLNNGTGTLYVRRGAVLIANGTINGNLYSEGLVIIPITQAGLVSRIRGNGRIVIPLPTPAPGSPPPVISFPTPPTFDPPQFFVPRGSGPGGAPGGGSPGGGGGPGSWTPGGGIVKIVTPSITFPGPVALDAELEVTGDVTQTATGSMRFYIAGNTRGQTYSALTVNKTLALDGGVQIVLRPELLGYLPRVGDTFDIMSADLGITLTSGSINLQTLMTAAGAAQLGISLPAFVSSYAGDPDTLVAFPSSLFSYSIVNGGKTLRLTMIAPVCGPSTGPVAAAACPTGSAPFSVTPNGSGPFTFQWQVQTPAGAWVNLGTTPVPIACTNGGFAQASATEPTGTSTSIRVVPCPATPGTTLNAQLFAVRALVISDCGSVPTSQAILTICPADFNCSGTLTVADIFAFLSAWFAGDPSTDVDALGGIQVSDIFAFLAAWFAGC